MAQRKPKVHRRQVKLQSFTIKASEIAMVPLPFVDPKYHIQDVPKIIHYRGKILHFYKRKLLRRGALLEIKKLKKRGIFARNYQVKRGRVVVDNVIYIE